MHRPRRQACLEGKILILLLCILAIPAWAGPLDEYVTSPDPTFGWRILSHTSLPGQNSSLYQLALTSQTWKGSPWLHRLSIVVPKGSLRHRTVLLYINGSGSGRDELTAFSILAEQLGAPVAFLFDVPNQPLYGGLREDALISFTFHKYLSSGDSEWPLLLPMTRAAVSAMDAITEFAGVTLGWSPEGFLVAGGSKRGWTTWLSAAVDDRVRAIVPIAYDNLDLPAQMELQVSSFGAFSAQIGDYTSLGLQQALETPMGQQLVEIVDPYTYRQRYTVPKLIIRGTNDPYWPLDAINLYLAELPGDSWLHYDPNAGHGLTDYETILHTVAGFYLHVQGELPLAPVIWQATETPEGLELSVQSPGGAASINVWTADATTRDFRQARWSSQSDGPGTERVFHVARPASGYRAVYGEVVLRTDDHVLVLDTPVQIIAAQ